MSENKDGDLWENGIYFLNGEIDTDSTADAIEWILQCNLENKLDRLNLLISSEGGDVWAGLALIDIITGSKIPVHTTGIGLLASMGLLIFISGKKGERVLTPNTFIMSHEFSSGVYGKHHELISARKSHDIVQEMIIRHYKKHTGLTEKQIKKHLLPPNDVYLTAKEALELKICDEVRLI
jgi:ATP-dependent Clp protease protease subunit